jgi:AcrR family transcriptional regulator
MRPSAVQTRDNILEAADRLFYAEGFTAASMDRIADRAGVTKKTLYYHFRSKDELMAAYLETRHGEVMARYQRWAGTTGTASDRIQRMFRRLAAASMEPTWRGCSFVRAVCELANLPGHPAYLAARKHKRTFEAWFAGLLKVEGRSNCDSLARVLMVLLDGAIVQVLIHKDPNYARAAASAARELLGRSTTSLTAAA